MGVSMAKNTIPEIKTLTLFEKDLLPLLPLENQYLSSKIITLL